MRFEVSQVMDAIEQRLTTDPTLAQAVIDLGDVARCAELDGGRAINLMRAGMAVDALSRYLVDAGAMLYAVVGRDLLSDAEMTSKERMVLGRWAEDGLIEVTREIAERAVEVADFTGLPLITVRPYDTLVPKFPWLAEAPERVLRLVPRGGVAVLAPSGAAELDPAVARAVVVGKAAVAAVAAAVAVATAAAEGVAASPPPDRPADADATSSAAAATRAATEPEATTSGAVAAALGAATTAASAVASAEAVATAAAAAATTATAPASGQVTAPPLADVFFTRGAQRLSHTLIARRRFTRAEPSATGASLLARRWHCVERDCAMFGEYRTTGQPVPTLHKGKPFCPRHGEKVTDAGPRPPAYAVSVVIDDLARRRFTVSAGTPVHIGKANPDAPTDISVGDWLHEAAEAWIDAVHLRLEISDEGRLVVTDLSANGTLVWRRPGPDDRAATHRLHRSSYALGEWDSVELYTGFELFRGDRRLTTVVGPTDPLSVLVNAPTVAVPQLNR